MNNKVFWTKAFVILLLAIVFIEFYQNMEYIPYLRNDYSKNYFFQHAANETGAKNIVASIYLDYRLFDSLFEASILLIAVSGITFISKKIE